MRVQGVAGRGCGRSGSVTAAADELGVTQSAVSHALQKLRAIVRDPLFVKSGRGIVATVDGQRIAVGNLRLIADEQPKGSLNDAGASAVVEELAAAGQTPMVVARDGQVIGVVAVADRIRNDAAEMVRRLHAAGVKKVVMLTGDIAPVARAVAQQVGVDENVPAQCSIDPKCTRLEKA